MSAAQPPPPPPPPPPAQQPPPAAPPPVPPPPPTRGLSGGLVALIVGLVVLAAAGAVVFLLVSGDDPATTTTVDPPQTPQTPIETPTETPTPTDTPTPTETPQVTLADLYPSQVGQFRLVDIGRDDAAITQLGANDALVARYQRRDGVEVIHMLMAFSSNFTADRAQTELGRELRSRGYVVVANITGGGVRATRLVLADEWLVWSRGALVAIARGPVDIPGPLFFCLLPYGANGGC